MQNRVNINTIKEAAKRIEPFVHQTPVLTSFLINEIVNASLFFKCENFQKVGAFKFRGACNAVFSLSEEQSQNGVATHSSGNHAAALALAAKLKNIPAYIVMPNNAPDVKKHAVNDYGGKITFCDPMLEARETNLSKVITKTGATEIHPYDNYDIISGAGTAALELINEFPDLDVVIAPVGGGGLLSGTSISVSELSPHTKIIAAEPINADDSYKSFKTGKIIQSRNPNTICDGLLTSLGKLTFPIIMENIDEVMTASEEMIIRSMRLIWERMKIIVEPSAAVTLAIILENLSYFKKKKIGLILSGGNIDIKSTIDYM